MTRPMTTVTAVTMTELVMARRKLPCQSSTMFSSVKSFGQKLQIAERREVAEDRVAGGGAR